MRAFTFKDTLAGTVLAALIGAASTAPALAQQQPSAPPPDFSSDHVGWSGFNPTGPFFEPAPGHNPGPVTTARLIPSFPMALINNRLSGSPIFRIRTLSHG